MRKIEKKLVKISLAASCAFSFMVPNMVYAESNDETSVQVDVYPKPQAMEYLSNEGMKLEGTVDLVVHGNQNPATLTKVKQLLDNEGIAFVEADNVSNDKATILITSNKEHCEECKDVEGDASVLEKNQGYILYASNDENKKGQVTIVGADEDGAYYGVVTLKQMMEQGKEDGTFAETVISDYPSVELRGFVEGFYGFPWSFEDRLSLMKESSEFKMNTYIYAPKDDPYHKDQWRDLYPADKAEELRQLAEEGKKDNMNFCWSVHPGNGFNYYTDDDFNALIRKFNQLYDLGVRQFGISYDDLDGYVNGQQHADLINRVNEEFVKEKGDVKPLIVVGTRYCNGWGPDMNSYFRPFFGSLDEDIVVMWTGANTMSAITKEAYDWPKQVTGVNKNLAAWWNYPVNDYCDGNLMMSPLENLDNDVDNLSGFFLNPMSQAEASKVAIFSGADYSWNITNFERTSSWKRAINELVPEANEAFERFADNISYIKDGFEFDESRYLVEDINNFVASLQQEAGIKEAAQTLKVQFELMKEDVVQLRQINNAGLLEEITQHLNAYEALAEAGSASMDAFIAAEDEDIDNCLSSINKTEVKLNEAETYRVDSFEGSSTKANVVKVGEKRIKPLLRDSVSQIKGLLMDNVFPQSDPEVIGTMDAASDKEVVVEQGNYVLKDVNGVLKANASVGVRLPKAMKVSKAVVRVQPVEDVKVQYSVNGYEWTDAEVSETDGELTAVIDDTATYVRLVNETEEDIDLVLESLCVYPVYNVGNKKVETDLGTYQSYVIEYAIDGNMSTKFYSSAGATVGSYVRVDLGKEIPLYDVSIYYAGNPKGPEHGIDGFAATKLEISKDGASWTQIGDIIEDDNYAQKVVSGQTVSFAEYNAEGQMARYIRFSATQASDNWVQVFEVPFNETTDILGDDTIDIVETTFADGNINNLYDRDLTSAFAPSTVKDNDVLEYDMTTITNVGKLVIMQDSEAISNAVVSVMDTEGNWKEVGVLNEALTNLNVNDDILKVRLSFNGSNPTPVIYEIIAKEKEVVVDKGELEEVVAEAEKLNAADYTAESWEAFETALNEARAVLENTEATPEEIATATKALTDAMNALEMAEVSKAILEYAITLAEKITEEDLEGCVDVVVEYFNKALTNARKVYEDENATKAEVTEAWTTLFDAMHKLDWKKADVSILKDFVEYANTLVKEDYYESGWTRFEKALAAAKELIADGNNMDQEAVNAALHELMGAASELRSIPDKSELEDLITKVEGMKAEDYTAASWAAVEAALANAKAVYNAESNEAEVNAAKARLEEAVKGLQENPIPTEKGKLNEVIEKAEALDKKKYTAESFKTLEEALQVAKAVAKDENATQEEIEEALAKLTAAIDGLQPAEPTIPEQDKKPGEEGEGPDSGDSTNVGGLLTLLGLAGIAIAYETRKRMR